MSAFELALVGVAVVCAGCAIAGVWLEHLRHVQLTCCPGANLNWRGQCRECGTWIRPLTK